MKKYVKPELFFESYELSQSIAACGWDMNQGDPTTCTAAGDPSFGNPDILVFTESNCELVLDRYCYENGAESGPELRIFNS